MDLPFLEVSVECDPHVLAARPVICDQVVFVQYLVEMLHVVFADIVYLKIV